MTYLRRAVGLVCGLAMLSCLVACGGAMQQIKDAAEATEELNKLSTSYHAYHSEKKAGPASAEEWAKWAKDKPDQASVVPLIDKCKGGGKYTFYWGVNLDKMPAGATSDKVLLGYENKLPGQPGVVVTCDGFARFVQPAEFNGLTKPK